MPEVQSPMDRILAEIKAREAQGKVASVSPAELVRPAGLLVPEEGQRHNGHAHARALDSTGVSDDGNEDLKHSIQALSFSGREKPGPRGWIVENSLWEGHATSWFGEGGTAKSLLALHLGLTVAAEGKRNWMAFNVKTVPVLYLDFELDADEQHRRAMQLASGLGLEDVPGNFYYLSVAMTAPVVAFKAAAEECRRLGIKLVIVDSVGFALDGDSESARDVLGFYRACIQPLKDAGASPLLIDHQAKKIKGENSSDKLAFGSVYKTNAVRSSFQLRGSHDQGDGEMGATFVHKKNNFGWKEKDFSLKVVFEKERIMVDRLQMAMPNPEQEPSKKDQVREAMEKLERATAEKLALETGISINTIRNIIPELLREGTLKDTGDKIERSRIFTTHAHTTRGVGVGVKENGSSEVVNHTPTTMGAGLGMNGDRSLLQEEKEEAKRSSAESPPRPVEEQPHISTTEEQEEPHPPNCLCEGEGCLPV